MSSWIKFETATPDKPEVAIIAETLRIDPDEAVGKLLRVWTWADANTVPDQPVAVPLSFIDRIAHRKGFAAAMIAAGWLTHQGNTVTFPNFDRHNGQSAKARSVTARRVQNHRNRNTSTVTNVTQETLLKPLPEKEVQKNPSDIPLVVPPSADPVRLASIYPRRERFNDAVAEIARQLAKAEDPETLALTIETGTRAAAAVIKRLPSGDLNAYLPSSLEFFRSRRYLDDPETLNRNTRRADGATTPSAGINLGTRKPAATTIIP